MTVEQPKQISKRRAQIPRHYLATYDRAMAGKSRKAAMRAFCLECCGWEIREVFRCSDLACPLHPYRPRSRILQGAPQGVPNVPELKKVSDG